MCPILGLGLVLVIMHHVNGSAKLHLSWYLLHCMLGPYKTHNGTMAP